MAAATVPASSTAPTQPALVQQRKSIETQRQTIRKQVPVPESAAADLFFTAPWTDAAAIQPIVFAPVASAPPDNCDPIPEPQISALIDAAATREAVKPALVRAVMRQESGFRPCAVSARGAQGLMQLMPATTERLHVTNPFEPAENVNAGTTFLKELLVRYAGDLRLALAAYNAGPGRVDDSGGIPNVPETKDYVSNVLNELGTGGDDTGHAAK